MYRPCTAPTASGNPCISPALENGDCCAIHESPSTRREHMSELGRRSAAARRERAESEDGDDKEAALLACDRLESPEDVDEFLRAMARYAVQRDDPRWLSNAARVVETSKANIEAKKWRAECLEWRKRFKVKKTIIGNE